MTQATKTLIRQSSHPLHEAVRKEIVRRMDSSEFNPETPLPSTGALADEFGVSMITVKRALKDLKSEGLIVARPGLGTFVRPRHRFVRDLSLALNSVDDARRLGFEPSFTDVAVSREPVNKELSACFDVPFEEAYCIRKLILADAVPVMFDTAYVGIGVEEGTLDKMSQMLVYKALSESGTEITSADLVIEAMPASESVQKHFDVPSGYPSLCRRYCYRTADEASVVVGAVESPFDRLSCTIQLNV